MSASRLQPPSVLESSLYCPELDTAERFYRDVFGLEVVARQLGRHVFLRCGEGMVLLFNPDATADPSTPTGGQPVVPHGARGPGHLAFRLPERDIERWQAHLSAAGVPIEAEVHWPQGGYSLYLRDPAGNSIELATATLWGFAESPMLGGGSLRNLTARGRPAATAAEDDLMDQVGTPNPNAPAALSRFAFLIGRWRCEARVRSPDREWQTFPATWLGRFILDGYAIADEYRMTGPSGELIVLGLNLRTYDAAKQIWNIKWLNALAGTWVDLGPEELGGVRFEGQSIIYAFKEPVAAHAYTRATYTNVSKAHFTWRGEKSEDGETWSEFMVVEAYRTKGGRSS